LADVRFVVAPSPIWLLALAPQTLMVAVRVAELVSAALWVPPAVSAVAVVTPVALVET